MFSSELWQIKKNKNHAWQELKMSAEKSATEQAIMAQLATKLWKVIYTILHRNKEKAHNVMKGHYQH